MQNLSRALVRIVALGIGLAVQAPAAAPAALPAQGPAGASHGSAAHAPDAALTGAQTTVPFEVIDNHVYVDVRLNGQGPFRFAFDTGGDNLVDSDVAKRLGLRTRGSIEADGVGGQRETFRLTTVDSLALGGVTLRNQHFGVLPIATGFGAGAGERIDGLIGFEVLARFITTIDYGTHRLILRRPGAAASAGTTLPFVFHGHVPQIECRIAGVPGNCTVDTGSRLSLTVPAPFAAAHPQIVPSALSASGIDGLGIGGPARGRFGRVALDIGPFEIPDALADFSEQTRGAFADPSIAANLGGGVWKRFTVTFDYGRRTLSLQPNSAFSAPDAGDRSGLFLIARGGKIVVLDARPGTPAAEAGVATGDTLVVLDGIPVAKFTLREIREKLGGPAGTAVTLRLAAADSTERDAVVILRDYD
jgi:hypothetical protein